MGSGGCTEVSPVLVEGSSGEPILQRPVSKLSRFHHGRPRQGSIFKFAMEKPSWNLPNYLLADLLPLSRMDVQTCLTHLRRQGCIGAGLSATGGGQFELAVEVELCVDQ